MADRVNRVSFFTDEEEIELNEMLDNMYLKSLDERDDMFAHDVLELQPPVELEKDVTDWGVVISNSDGDVEHSGFVDKIREEPTLNGPTQKFYLTKSL